MKLSLEITEDQAWALNERFLQYSRPYGQEVKHINYVNSMSCYLNNKDLAKFIEIRDQLTELGILNYLAIDSTYVLYELTEIGWMFYNEVNKQP